MLRSIRAAFAGLLLCALSIAGPALAQSPLRADLEAIAGKAGAPQAASVRFTLTNTGRTTVRVLAWQTPFEGIEHDVFEIGFGNEPVAYVGLWAKRGAPSAADYLVFKPGESRSVEIDLSEAYAMSKTGTYSVRYRTLLADATDGAGRPLAKGGLLPSIASAPLLLYADGSEAFLREPAPGFGTPAAIKALNPSPSFERCTTTQQSELVTALNAARAYAVDSRGYTNGGRTGARYTTWFGTYLASRYTTVNAHYNAIDDALGNQVMTFNCGCKKQYFAYVYPNQPYRIYLCRAFWNAANTGTDSRAGTLIHEVSHFDVVANTDDVVYGTANAKALATSNPNDAVRNADNHEYFSENTPAQN
jgi:peptidyl-Lys metalloendopeptidase